MNTSANIAVLYVVAKFFEVLLHATAKFFEAFLHVTAKFFEVNLHARTKFFEGVSTSTTVTSHLRSSFPERASSHGSAALHRGLITAPALRAFDTGPAAVGNTAEPSGPALLTQFRHKDMFGSTQFRHKVGLGRPLQGFCSDRYAKPGAWALRAIIVSALAGLSI